MTEPNFTHEFSATTSVQDFKLRNVGPAPTGYPTKKSSDTYSKFCVAENYSERRKLFIEYVKKNPGVDSIKGFFYELIRLDERENAVHESMLFAALDYIDNRYDCADFVLAGILRLYYQLIDNPLLSDKFREKARQTILGFKYWPDEPGVDSMCYWTENHHIIFSSCEYLAGQLFPDEIFSNSGMRGVEKKAKAKIRIEKWLELRFYTGFNEWLSNVYYDENFPPLLNLLDFADEPELARRSKNIVDLMLYDMALNSYYGLYCCTHGRTYTKEKIHPHLESTSDTAKLMFGLGTFSNEDNMSAVVFALSKNYTLPKVIFDIANATALSECENKQRVSIKFRDAEKWGYGKLDLESAMGLLSFGGYTHHRTFSHMILMLDKFKWWDNQFFLEFAPFKRSIQLGKKIGLTKLIAWLLRKDLSRNTLEENNIYTYRTPDYMLSTSQDYRKSYGGDQHHIWQATLDDAALCFTTHPGGYGLKAPDAYWHGNGFMPKAMQYKNVAVILYNTPRIPTIAMQQTLGFTHAFFPAERFDRIVEQNGWIFGLKNDGYIALYSSNSYRWQDEGEYQGREIIVEGRKNVWVVEMGRKARFGSFENFVKQINEAPISSSVLKVNYTSPSVGPVAASWNKPLNVDGKKVDLTEYKRYQNASCHAEFGSDTISISHSGESYQVNHKA